MKPLLILWVLLLSCHLLPVANCYAAAEDELQEKALLVLKTKCNTCHIRNNPFKVFNSRNMNRHAAAIYEQVFVKGRMPKGTEVTLTAAERDILRSWLGPR
ncbi:hypothetical protein [Chitinophaga nivalis]|uniref:Cytochrome c domain-containing protein n=1 Tax=Chitinophaga nivalis TaxID=2991709 RepID=A0ABT3IK26_9BACT|nr:hypothetical protein [Chitinophaga nivalis]MCW3465993.1 hypothetical protein [Chitinophaga nivalis]MCW3484316.1 hypothetical protein [Chitinophaga nivalis]